MQRCRDAGPVGQTSSVQNDIGVVDNALDEGGRAGGAREGESYRLRESQQNADTRSASRREKKKSADA